MQRIGGQVSRAAGYGIDSTDNTHVTWCKCGWRNVATDIPTARTQVVDHMETVHGIRSGTTMRIRSPKQAAMWGAA